MHLYVSHFHSRCEKESLCWTHSRHQCCYSRYWRPVSKKRRIHFSLTEHKRRCKTCCAAHELGSVASVLRSNVMGERRGGQKQRDECVTKQIRTTLKGHNKEAIVFQNTKFNTQAPWLWVGRMEWLLNRAKKTVVHPGKQNGLLLSKQVECKPNRRQIS